MQKVVRRCADQLRGIRSGTAKMGEDAKIAVRSIRQQARKQTEAAGRGSLGSSRR
jgi:hypothetical protein